MNAFAFVETSLEGRALVFVSLTIIAVPYYRDRRPGAVRGAQSFVAEILADFDN